MNDKWEATFRLKVLRFMTTIDLDIRCERPKVSGNNETTKIKNPMWVTREKVNNNNPSQKKKMKNGKNGVTRLN